MLLKKFKHISFGFAVTLIVMELGFRLELFGGVGFALVLPPILFAFLIDLTESTEIGRSSKFTKHLIGSYASSVAVTIPVCVIAWIPIHMVSEILLRLSGKY